MKILTLLLFVTSISNEIINFRDESIIKHTDLIYENYQNELLKKDESVNQNVYIKHLEEKIQNLYLLDENNLPIKFKDVRSKLTFKQINLFDKKNRKTLRKGINALKIMVSLDSNIIKVQIVEFKIKLANNTINFTNMGGSVYVYEYSCKNGDWQRK